MLCLSQLHNFWGLVGKTQMAGRWCQRLGAGIIRNFLTYMAGTGLSWDYPLQYLHGLSMQPITACQLGGVEYKHSKRTKWKLCNLFWPSLRSHLESFSPSSIGRSRHKAAQMQEEGTRLHPMTRSGQITLQKSMWDERYCCSHLGK